MSTAEVEMTSGNLAHRYRLDSLPDYNRPIDQAFAAFEVWKEGFKAPRPSHRTIEAYDIITNSGKEELTRFNLQEHLVDGQQRWIGRRDTQTEYIYERSKHILC